MGFARGFYQTRFLGESQRLRILLRFHPHPPRPLFCSVSGLGMLCPQFALSLLVRPPQISTLGFSGPNRRSLCPESLCTGGRGGAGPPERLVQQESDIQRLCEAGSQPRSKVGGNIIYWLHVVF